jgi:hypothetical protein
VPLVGYQGRAGARHLVLYAAAVVEMAVTGPAPPRRACDTRLPRGIASRPRILPVGRVPIVQECPVMSAPTDLVRSRSVRSR